MFTSLPDVRGGPSLQVRAHGGPSLPRVHGGLSLPRVRKHLHAHHLVEHARHNCAHAIAAISEGLGEVRRHEQQATHVNEPSQLRQRGCERPSAWRGSLLRRCNDASRSVRARKHGGQIILASCAPCSNEEQTPPPAQHEDCAGSKPRLKFSALSRSGYERMRIRKDAF